jgi:hypothetical protein
MKTRVGPGLIITTYALSLGCAYSLHGGFSGHATGTSSGDSTGTPTSTSGDSAPASTSNDGPSTPATKVSSDSAPSKRGSKRGGDDESPGAAFPMLSTPPEISAGTGVKVSSTWNGTSAPSIGSCSSDEPVFKASGPDVQTFPGVGWAYHPGFKCPGTCTNPTNATIASGKMSFPLVWVDDHPPMDSNGRFTVTMRRYRFDIPLDASTDKANKKTLVGRSVTYKTSPFKWSHNNIYNMLSDGFAVLTGVVDQADVHRGTGRVALLKVQLHDPAPGSPEYEWSSDAEAACDQLMYRSDWKAGDGQDDGGDEESSPSASSSSSSAGAASSARRKCKNQCKTQAGSCRMSCHGQSAKCASNCNHDESSCERSC